MFNPEEHGFEPSPGIKRYESIEGKSFMRVNYLDMVISITAEDAELAGLSPSDRMRTAFDANGRVAIYPDSRGVKLNRSGKRLNINCDKMHDFWFKAMGIPKKKGMKTTRFFMEPSTIDGALVLTPTGENEEVRHGY